MDTTIQACLGRGSVGRKAAGTVRSRSGASDQIRDGQLLVDDQVMVIHQASRQLMQGVPAAVPDPTVRGRDALHGTAPMLGASLFGGEVLLGSSEAVRGALGVTVVGDQGPVAGRHKDRHAEVDPDLAAGRG